MLIGRNVQKPTSFHLTRTDSVLFTELLNNFTLFYVTGAEVSYNYRRQSFL